MSVQTHGVVVEMIPLNAFAWFMTIEVGAEMAGEIACGQFVHIKCGDAHLLRRPISICTWQENCLRVVFEVRGEGTRWLSQRQVGSQIDILGPVGHGFDIAGEKLLLVGGGIGVPPMLGCAQAVAARGGRAVAALGFRDAAHSMLLPQFEACCHQVSVISDDGSTGRKGFVTELVEEQLATGGFDAVLACGPKAMLKGVAAVAQAHGVPCQVSLEERMGCGVGACLVCACQTADGQMRHVCKDGPVFPAQEVDWDA